MMRKYQKEKYQINLVSVFAVDLPYATVIPPVTFLGLTLDTPETPKTPNPTPLNMFPGQIQILYCHARQCAENFFLYGFYSKENLLWTNSDNLFRIDQIFPRPHLSHSFLLFSSFHEQYVRGFLVTIENDAFTLILKKKGPFWDQRGNQPHKCPDG